MAVFEDKALLSLGAFLQRLFNGFLLPGLIFDDFHSHRAVNVLAANAEDVNRQSASSFSKFATLLVNSLSHREGIILAADAVYVRLLNPEKLSLHEKVLGMKDFDLSATLASRV